MKLGFSKRDWALIAVGAVFGLLTLVYFPDVLGQYPIDETLRSFVPEQHQTVSPGQINLVGLLGVQFVSGAIAGGLYAGETRGAVKRGYVAGAVSFLVPFFVGVIFFTTVFLIPLALEGAIGTFVILMISGVFGVGLTTLVVLAFALLAGLAGGLGHLVREALVTIRG